MLVVYLFISYLVHQSYQDVTSKCCDENYAVEESANLTLKCVSYTKSDARFQVWSNLNSFLINNTDGECIDIDSSNKHFYNYTINSSVLVTKTLIESKEIFPKCCPLNYVYNNITHSCVKSNITENHIEKQFVKIGLPHCRIIIDKYFKNHNKAIEWKNLLNSGSYCMDKDIRNEFVIRECQEGLEICENKRCFRKCCQDGQSFVGGGTCMDTFVHGLKLEKEWYSPYITDIEDDYELIYGAKCPKVSLLRQNSIQYSIGKNGQFQYFYNFSKEFVENKYSDLESYCLEHATKGSVSGYHFFLCVKEIPLLPKYALTLWAKVLSCILLVVTLLVYFYLGEVKSTFGKILVNYCMAMTLLMVTLVVAHVNMWRPERWECKFRAYSLIFFNMSAFAWVNIMSLDIWWTFGTPRRTIGSDQRRQDLKKFLFYFLYGWGMPLCHGLLILLFDLTTILPESIQPYLGIYLCFFEERNYGKAVFFLVPQLIFQIVNTVLFMKTITYCIRVKNEISRMNDTSRKGRFAADKEKLGLIVKLAIIMGVVWVFEVTTAFFNMRTYSEFTKHLEVVMDTITCLQGVFIFLIFICKKKTLNTIKAKLGFGERRISCSVSQTSHVNGHYPMNKRQTTISLNETKI